VALFVGEICVCGERKRRNDFAQQGLDGRNLPYKPRSLYLLGRGVMVREKNVLATSFHPELTGDLRVHRYFLEMLDQQGKVSTAA